MLNEEDWKHTPRDQARDPPSRPELGCPHHALNTEVSRHRETPVPGTPHSIKSNSDHLLATNSSKDMTLRFASGLRLLGREEVEERVVGGGARGTGLCALHPRLLGLAPGTPLRGSVPVPVVVLPVPSGDGAAGRVMLHAVNIASRTESTSASTVSKCSGQRIKKTWISAHFPRHSV